MMRKLAKEWEHLKATGWQCQACQTWNGANRHKCWHCNAWPETRMAPK